MLSDAEQRHRYDAGGAAAVDSEGVDSNAATAMFALVLGTEEFEPLIGLHPSLQPRVGPHEMSAAEGAFRQLRREAECAAAHLPCSVKGTEGHGLPPLEHRNASHSTTAGTAASTADRPYVAGARTI